VPISDGQFRTATLASVLLVAAGLGSLRFCGGVSLPPRPEAPTAAPAPGVRGDLRAASTVSTPVYQDFLARDAAAAGVATPTLDEMARVFPYRVDGARHVLEVGRRPIDVAGMKLAAVRAGETIALELRNETKRAVAYRVVSAPAAEGCEPARPLPLNAMVIAAGERETRVECAWREGLAIAVTRVETLELPPLSAWYVSQVPPVVVGLEPQVARGHRVDGGRGSGGRGSGGRGSGGRGSGGRGSHDRGDRDPCTTMVAQAVKTGVEQGEISWRDLVDFYARHRCQTYQFPLTYRAFTKEGPKTLPATEEGG
jgi:uncharacterized membrane protein YgcG